VLPGSAEYARRLRAKNSAPKRTLQKRPQQGANPPDAAHDGDGDGLTNFLDDDGTIYYTSRTTTATMSTFRSQNTMRSSSSAVNDFPSPIPTMQHSYSDPRNMSLGDRRDGFVEGHSSSSSVVLPPISTLLACQPEEPATILNDSAASWPQARKRAFHDEIRPIRLHSSQETLTPKVHRSGGVPPTQRSPSSDHVSTSFLLSSIFLENLLPAQH